MAKTLDVYLHDKLVGYLTQDDDGQMLFEYAPSWLEASEAVPLSQSLPLRKNIFTRTECRGFFAGILPEENKRDTIARNLGISAGNDYAMLERIGGECAGAVTFVPAGELLQDRQDTYRCLGDKELAKILRELPRRPLMAGEEGVRLSLAGAQDKIAVHVSGNNISVPLRGAPSTHILKPAIERFEGVVFNEAVCMNLAGKVGLPTARVTIGKVEGIDYLLVERYDRARDSEGNTRRVHQEDFCQALGVVPERKYQSEGGPTLKQCFDLVRNVSAAPVIDLQHLLDAVIFHALIGNHDAHAKNFSLLNGEDGSVRLAPLYDVVSTVYYPELSQHLAMKIGGVSVSDHLFPQHFDTLAEEAGLAKPMVVQRVTELTHKVLSRLQDIEINHEVADQVLARIKERCEGFLHRFKK